jgi:hypothetical protein
MTNDDVIALVRAGVGPKLIQGQIRSSKTAFDLSTGELIRLARAGVPEELIEAMRAPGASRPAAPGPISVTLDEGRPVKLVLAQDITGDAVRAGDAVRLAVAEDVKVSDRVAIRKGAPATGSVSVERRKIFRKRPRVALTLERVTAADGQEVRIRPTAERGGPRAVPLAEAAGGPGAAIMAAQGSAYDAYLDETRTVRLSAPGTPAAANP